MIPCLLKKMTNCFFSEFFSAWPLMAWILVRSTWSFSTRYKIQYEGKILQCLLQYLQFLYMGKTIKYGSLWISGTYCTVKIVWRAHMSRAKSRLTAQVNIPCEFYIYGRHCWISTELEKGGRNLGRRKVDISVHVGWELVGRGMNCIWLGEGQN